MDQVIACMMEHIKKKPNICVVLNYHNTIVWVTTISKKTGKINLYCCAYKFGIHLCHFQTQYVNIYDKNNFKFNSL